MSAATDIRPFRIDIPQAELDDLSRRLETTRWDAGAASDFGLGGGDAARVHAGADRLLDELL